jgi:hypothetical protein
MSVYFGPVPALSWGQATAWPRWRRTRGSSTLDLDAVPAELAPVISSPVWGSCTPTPPRPHRPLPGQFECCCLRRGTLEYRLVALAPSRGCERVRYRATHTRSGRAAIAGSRTDQSVARPWEQERRRSLSALLRVAQSNTPLSGRAEWSWQAEAEVPEGECRRLWLRSSLRSLITSSHRSTLTECAPMSRWVLRAPGGPVDLDRYALRVHSRLDQVKRDVRAGVGE